MRLHRCSADRSRGIEAVKEAVNHVNNSRFNALLSSTDRELTRGPARGFFGSTAVTFNGIGVHSIADCTDHTYTPRA